jgi:hypothetical protein
MKARSNSIRVCILAAGIAASFFSTQARAAELFGYFEFDYGQTTKDGQKTYSSTKSGDFDTAFVSLMMQHEVDIYKFFTEIELQHGAEVTGDSTGATTSTPNAAIVVERAYAEMHFHPMFNVVVGKSLSPTLWKTNHYPNIVKTATEPMMVSKEVIHGGYVGPMIYGNLGYGVTYNIWTDRSSNNSSLKEGNNAFSRFGRLGYEYAFSGGSVAVSYITGSTEDTVTTGTDTVPKVYKPTSMDLNLSIGKFLLWVESATSDGSNGQQGAYAVASYSFDVNGAQELSPFILLDQYKQDSTTTTFLNTGAGVNYKPQPNVVHKLQYYAQKNDPAQSQASDGFANGDQQIKYQFVYFYN